MLQLEETVNCAAWVKEQTKKLHAETEALLIPKIKEARTREEYASILHIFYGFYAPLEQQLNLFVTDNVLADWPQRRKAALLLHDLQRLGKSIEVPVCTQLPAVTTVNEAMGVLYVLEGSTLGGKIIAGILQKNTGLSEDAFTFFNGYGAENETMWLQFKRALNSWATDQEKINAITVSANHTFQSLKNWIITL